MHNIVIIEDLDVVLFSYDFVQCLELLDLVFVMFHNIEIAGNTLVVDRCF